MTKKAEQIEALTVEDYCGSRWAHKPHAWYDKHGVRVECPGRETKPGERQPGERGSRNG